MSFEKTIFRKIALIYIWRILEGDWSESASEPFFHFLRSRHLWAVRLGGGAGAAFVPKGDGFAMVWVPVELAWDAGAEVGSPWGESGSPSQEWSELLGWRAGGVLWCWCWGIDSSSGKNPHGEPAWGVPMGIPYRQFAWGILMGIPHWRFPPGIPMGIPHWHAPWGFSMGLPHGDCRWGIPTGIPNGDSLWGAPMGIARGGSPQGRSIGNT